MLDRLRLHRAVSESVDRYRERYGRGERIGWLAALALAGGASAWCARLVGEANAAVAAGLAEASFAIDAVALARVAPCLAWVVPCVYVLALVALDAMRRRGGDLSDAAAARVIGARPRQLLTGGIPFVLASAAAAVVAYSSAVGAAGLAADGAPEFLLDGVMALGFAVSLAWVAPATYLSYVYASRRPGASRYLRGRRQD